MVGNIQHSSPGASQSFQLNVETIHTALQNFEEELKKLAIEDRVKLNELAAEVTTIKAQLTKASPSLLIMREAAKSVRSITEGVVADAMTSPILAAAIALGTALGLH